MTNGEKIQTILNVDRDCTEVHGENGIMTFTVTQDFWNAEYEEPSTPNDCENCIHNKGVLECDMYGCKYEPTTKNDLGVDCISRADARSLICNTDIKHHMSGMSRKVFKDLYNGMDELPSVTPQEPREITLEDVKGYCKPRLLTIITNELYHELIHSKIKALEQEPRKGHWICDGKGRSFADYHCSECGLKLALCGQDIKQRQDSGYSLFCGGCGADMREVIEE